MIELYSNKVIVFDDVVKSVSFEHMEENRIYYKNSQNDQYIQEGIIYQTEIIYRQKHYFQNKLDFTYPQQVQQQIVLNYHGMINERVCQLPLQINHNIFNLYKQQENKSKDMPKQIKNDIYRNEVKGKENKSQKYESKNIQSPYPFDHQVLFPSKESTIKKQNNRSSHLRDIIKKRLFEAQKNALKLQPKNKTLTIKQQHNPYEEQPKPNRYQSLLRQIYGTPKTQVLKVRNQNSKFKQQKQSEFQMKRHQSVRNITEILKTQQKQANMSRYKSHLVIEKAPVCLDCRSKRKNSSKLKSELSKIPTYLDLYNQNKKLVLVQ